MHGQCSAGPDVGEVVKVVLLEGPALAGDEGPELPTGSYRGLLKKGAANHLEGADRLAMVMPFVVCSCRPGQEPDLEVRAGFELDTP